MAPRTGGGRANAIRCKPSRSPEGFRDEGARTRAFGAPGVLQGQAELLEGLRGLVAAVCTKSRLKMYSLCRLLSFVSLLVDFTILYREHLVGILIRIVGSFAIPLQDIYPNRLKDLA